MTCYLDTQVTVWLCQKQLDRLTPRATAAIEESELRMPPIVQPPQALLSQLESQLGLKPCSHPFPAIVQTALFETWTHDPFDRVIVAHARSTTRELCGRPR